MLEFARAMMHGYSPISEAEDRLRRLTSSDTRDSRGPSAEMSNPMERQASIESTQHAAAGRVCHHPFLPSVGRAGLPD